MKITRLETFLTCAGIRNYLFIRLTTDTGLTGIGEATLEWQEKAVATLVHEWAEARVVGQDPFEIEKVAGGMIRDQYQGGSTVMTVISGIEIAMWDIIGKACQQPVYKLLGGRCHSRLPAYANGWYGGSRTAEEYGKRAKEVAAMGYKALKFAEALVAAVREATGPQMQLMIEFHGRLSVGSAVEVTRRLERFHPTWIEEPTTPESLDLLLQVKQQVAVPVAAGERLYTLPDFYRLTALRAADVVQMDVAHCGGILVSKKIAAMAAAQDMRISPHCSIGPVALAAAMHVDASTPNFMVQEFFGDFDVPWRNSIVRGWNPVQNGELVLPEKPGLGLDIDEAIIAAHPYVQSPLPSLWDSHWLTKLTPKDAKPKVGDKS
jgi:galactonate dehydratase